MEYVTFFKALSAGFLLSVPIGPVNLICIRHTLEHGRQSGLIAGLGAAAADGLYALIAAVGLGTVTSFITRETYWLQISSGLFIVYLGIKSLMRQPAGASSNDSRKSLFTSFLKTLFITLANPVSILALISVMTAFNITATGLQAAISITLGVFSGSALWWLLLSTATGLLRDKINDKLLSLINQGSGVIIIVIGLVTIFSQH